MDNNPIEFQDATPAEFASKAMWICGCVISALPILMMGVGPAVFLFMLNKVAAGMKQYGYPEADARYILITQMCCAILYAIPKTAVLGAILLTGYLGGAIATHVRVGEPPVMPMIFGVLVWLGLFLRDGRLRALIPFRR